MDENRKPIKCMVGQVITNNRLYKINCVGNNGTEERIITRAELDRLIASKEVELMIKKAKSLDKNRDKNGNITGYVIEDQFGNIMEFSSEKLKFLINNYKLDVVNLTLTSDNRLIDKKKGINEARIDLNKRYIDVELTKDMIDKALNAVYVYGLNHVVFVGVNNRVNKDYLIKTAKPIPNTPLSLTRRGSEAIIFLTDIENGNMKLPKDCNCLFSGHTPQVWDNVKTLSLYGLDWSVVEKTQEMFMCNCFVKISITNSTAPRLNKAVQQFVSCKAGNINIKGLDIA